LPGRPFPSTAAGRRADIMARAKNIALSETEDLPEADRLEGFAHPRETAELYGHAGIEATLLQLVQRGTLPHGLLMTGARGIGKATLAYRLARFVLRHGVGTDAAKQASPLYIEANDPVFRRVSALGHTDLMVLRRAYDTQNDRLKTEISV